MEISEYIVDETFDTLDFSASPLIIGSYEDCHFNNCNFMGANLNNIQFLNCQFKNCNLSSASVIKTALKNVSFLNCKITGMLFCDCNPFLFEIKTEDCQLNYASFYSVKLKKMVFKNTSLEEVDFTDADLKEVQFTNCNLKNAKFENTNLEKANLASAYNYQINPLVNKISKAIFSMPDAMSLLNNFNIVIK